MLAAKPKHFDQHTLDELRRWVHGYQAKFATEPNPHPPDPFLLAQLLTIAPLDQLIRLIQDLMCERKQPGYSYAWFVSVALQRIHGIAPQAFKTRRAQLKIVKSGSPPPPAQDGMQFASDLVSQVSARIGRPGR